MCSKHLIQPRCSEESCEPGRYRWQPCQFRQPVHVTQVALSKTFLSLPAIAALTLASYTPIQVPFFRPSRLKVASAILFLLPVLLSGCHRNQFPNYPANYREFAYVSNGDPGTVTVLDLVYLRQDRVLQVGRQPTGMAVNPIRNEVYAKLIPGQTPSPSSTPQTMPSPPPSECTVRRSP